MNNSGLWVTDDILSDKGLNKGEKLVFAIISSFAKNGACSCDNFYIGKRLGITTNRAAKYIVVLENKGYIEITTINNKRILKVLKKYKAVQ